MAHLRQLLFVLSLAGVPGGNQGLSAEHSVVLASESLRLAVEQSTGSLAECRDLISAHNFTQSATGCWELQVISGGKSLKLTAADATRFHDNPAAGTVRGRRLTWDHFPAPFPPDLAVHVLITLQEHDLISRWRMSVSGLPPDALKQARFPIINNILPQADEHLAVPLWMGQMTSEPRHLFSGTNRKGRRSEWHYPGALSMQCLALWGSKAGLYLACNDTASFRKAFVVHGDGSDHLDFELIHWPEHSRASEASWTLPYEVELGTFHGDWFTAAEQYRSWATNQPWARESRLATRAVPQWLRDTSLWVWNRGRSKSVLDPAIELQRRLGLPVSVFWHWWHGCSYDTGFPEYFPPREGTEEFQRAVTRAHKDGINALVYMNQRLWGMRMTSWTNEGAAAWAVKTEDGKIHPEIYNTFTHAPCASMCLGTAFWRNKYATLAQKAVWDLGVSGIYMDQACLSMSCFDPSHGHPVGGGSYWVNGFQLLASDIRNRCGPPTGFQKIAGLQAPALAGEGCGESWLPQLDLMLSLQVSKERYAGPDGWETIPFFHAVYHPYALLFGNYSSLTMPPYDELWPARFAPKHPLKLLDAAYLTQFRLEQARAFVWGQQPTIANFTPAQIKTRAADIDYVMRLAKLRNRSTRYLLQGTLLRAPSLTAAEATIPMSRLSIYAGQQGTLKKFEKRVPLALASAWRAPDGQVAIALASISPQPQQVSLSIPTKQYGLRPGTEILLQDEWPVRSVGQVHEPKTELPLELLPCGACILEFETKP